MSALITISQFSSGAVLIAALIILLRRPSKRVWLLFGLAILYVVTELVASSLVEYLGNSNLSILPVYLTLELILITYYFKEVMSDVKVLKIVLYFLLVLSVDISLVPGQYYTLIRVFQQLVIANLCIKYFRFTYSVPERKIERIPETWISLGLLVFFVPTLIIVVFNSNWVQTPEGFVNSIYYGKDALNILSKSLITFGICLQWRV